MPKKVEKKHPTENRKEKEKKCWENRFTVSKRFIIGELQTIIETVRTIHMQSSN